MCCSMSPPEGEHGGGVVPGIMATTGICTVMPTGKGTDRGRLVARPGTER